MSGLRGTDLLSLNSYNLILILNRLSQQSVQLVTHFLIKHIISDKNCLVTFLFNPALFSVYLSVWALTMITQNSVLEERYIYQTQDASVPYHKFYSIKNVKCYNDGNKTKSI